MRTFLPADAAEEWRGHWKLVVASAFGVHAVDLIAEGKFDRMVAWQNRRVVSVPLAEAIARPQQVDPDSALVKGPALVAGILSPLLYLGLGLWLLGFGRRTIPDPGMSS